jgi:hypothetical protein
LLTTPHTIIGIYLITHLKPWIALPAALISHYLFDFFYPHWNPHLFTEIKKHGKLSTKTLIIIALDALTAISFILYFSFQVLPNYNQIILIFSASFLSVLPDLLEIPYYFFHTKNKHIRQMVIFEHSHQAKANIYWGNITQILLIILCLISI